MPGYRRGSREHLNKLVESIMNSCNNIKNHSRDNDEDIQNIIDDLTNIYLDYASRWATKRERDVREIDIPDFMK